MKKLAFIIEDPEYNVYHVHNATNEKEYTTYTLEEAVASLLRGGFNFEEIQLPDFSSEEDLGVVRMAHSF